MMDLHGYAGKILWIDLGRGEVREKDLDRGLVRLYLGGTGCAARILWDMLEAGIDPLSPDNLLIAATGPLTGTLCPSSGSVEFCFKSPLTGIFGESRAGGSFGPRLKFAGYDLIVVRGRSEKPVYLHIRDRYAELRDASHLWGKNVHETTDILLRDLAEPDASVACIGQAGENLVRFASIMVDYDRAAGRCGGGAVMGAKRLKAVVVDGHGEISAAKPDEFFDAALEAINVVKARADKGMGRYGTLGGLIRLNESGALPTRNFKTCYFEEAEKVSGQTLSEKYLIKKRACFGCPIGCGRYIQVPAGDYRTPPHEGAEYETVDMLGVQSMIGDLEAIIKAGYLCNIYGLDTISAGNVIAFAIEAYERGIITEEDAGGIRLRWGDPGVTLALIEKIVKKEGIGRLLAEGVKRASEKLGKGSEEFACHGKGLEIPAHDPRGTSKSLAIQYAVGNPRGACHIEPIWSPMWDFSKVDMGLRRYGLPWPPPSRFEEEGVGRGEAYRLLILFGELAGILGICRFPLQAAEGENLDLDMLSRLTTTLTGLDLKPQDLLKISERVYNLKRCFNVREGVDRRSDKLPRRMMEPIASGPTKGIRVENLDGMLDEFYDAMGWDRETGIPRREKLVELGLGDVAEEVWRSRPSKQEK